jgi:hypothetical protein
MFYICCIFKNIHCLFQIWNFLWTCLHSFVYHHVFRLWSSWCFFIVHNWLQDFKFSFMETFFNVYLNSVKFKMLEKGGKSDGSCLEKDQYMYASIQFSWSWNQSFSNYSLGLSKLSYHGCWHGRSFVDVHWNSRCTYHFIS